MWTAGLLSFAILLMYIHAEVAWPLADRNLLLGYGALSALTIGRLSEGRAWGLWGWSLIHLTALGFWVYPRALAGPCDCRVPGACHSSCSKHMAFGQLGQGRLRTWFNSSSVHGV